MGVARRVPCLGCGTPSRTSYCARCAGPLADYNDREYRINRAVLLARSTHCALCGQRPTKDDPLTADHITPLEQGGTNELSNLQAAHLSCNSRRGASRT